MAIERIESASDPRLIAYRGLRDAELLRARHLFAAEGRLVVRRVLEDSGHRVESILVNDAALNDLEQAVASLTVEVPVFVCAADVLASVAGYDVHRGCLALVHRPPPTAVDTIVSGASLLVVLEAVTNADNVGSVFRNAAAFGAGGVLLSPTCCDPLYRKAIRTSMAATLRVPSARMGGNDAEWLASLAALGAEGFTLVALCAQPPALDIAEFASYRAGKRLALLVGSEGPGLTPAALALAHQRVRIPMRAEVDSLNLSVAVGIALHRLTSSG
jgi:tRNA G18 (ribose-2'-O)-methylase SpoU